jgi:beta-galactosidase
MTSHPFGTDWRFGPASAGSDLPGFDDSGFAEVILPHTVVPLSWRDWEPLAWERVWMYRKRFDAPPGADRGRVLLDFAAAMTRAAVTLNGTEVTDHLGGYLPFRAEISGLLRPAGNVLAGRWIRPST